MKYYRVKPEYDNKKIYKNGRFVTFLVENELYTQGEVYKCPEIVKYCTVENISKNRVYWFFGCRFEEE